MLIHVPVYNSPVKGFQMTPVRLSYDGVKVFGPGSSRWAQYNDTL
jgi:hypothetical protein